MYIFNRTIYFSAKEMAQFRKFVCGEEPKQWFANNENGIFIHGSSSYTPNETHSYPYECEPMYFYATQIIQLGLSKSYTDPENIFYINMNKMISYLCKLYIEREENPEHRMKYDIKNWSEDVFKPFRKMEIYPDNVEYKISSQSKKIDTDECLNEPLWQVFSEALHETTVKEETILKAKNLFEQAAEFNTYKV